MSLLIDFSIIQKINFLRLFLAMLSICEGRPFTFCKKFLWKAFIPLPKGSNGWIRQFYTVLDDKGGLRKPENHSRVETRLVIRPYTVENCRRSSLAPIRKGLGTENIPFLGSSYCRIASEKVYGKITGEI